MNTLFIIGNGFDCYLHKMKTQYTNFKDFLLERFPDCNQEFSLLEKQIAPDGSDIYNLNDVVGSIIRIIDSCQDDNWKTLEACLGSEYVSEIVADNECFFNEINWHNMDDKFDKERRHGIYSNQDLAADISGAYSQLIILFEDWVRNVLGTINYTMVKKKKKPSFKNALFLSFNYTHTLESVYGVNAKRVCHIHGDALDSSSKLYFGHGEDASYHISDSYFGIQEAFESMIRYMRKDTEEAFLNNISFFNQLRSIRKIYSYGFSFADVDMYYIEEIARILSPSRVRWYFNEYDAKHNKSYIDKIKKLGFKVRVTHRWSKL